ncbi:hypothetical protein AB0L35_38175 [Streptomyces sp. NPDC052309]|uniref:hypothetical protein n=1 Tax=Streptomyces sp. NPDC052309 TaxID=3155421 RepID=UPI003432FB8A
MRHRLRALAAHFSRALRQPLTATAAVTAILIGITAAPEAVADTSASTIPVRTATPADDVNHPGTATEWWYAEVSDPGTKQTFIVNFVARPTPSSIAFWYDANGNKTHQLSLATPAVTTDQPSVSSSAGSLGYDSARGAYHLVYNANGYKADIWFDNALPGVTAGPINYDGQWMSWTVPVGTSTVTGWVQPPGSDRISVNGWRGYHDHNWGDFLLDSQSYSGWEWGVSHENDGSATLYGGVVDGDGVWQGVLADVTPQGTSGCQTDISLSDWTSQDNFAYPATVGLNCRDNSITPRTFHVVGPHVVNVGTYTFTEAVTQTEPGSVGLNEHFRTLAHGGTSTAPLTLPLSGTLAGLLQP